MDDNLPKLKIKKEEAKKKITERIELGKKIYLDFSLKNTYDKLMDRKIIEKWNDYNYDLLKNIFLGTIEYQKYCFFSTARGGTSQIGADMDTLFNKISQLESIYERLDLYGEIATINAPLGNQETITPSSKNIFIIHGQDEVPLLHLKNLLKDELNLNPIILKEQPDRGSKTIIEKFELYAPQCSYAIALFTPDDIIRKDGVEYLQARPNVIYELGWFCAKITRDKVMLLLKEGTNIFSDFQGIIQKRFIKNVNELFLEIKKELKAFNIIN
jgi:predicted nucleotide-binding protein